MTARFTTRPTAERLTTEALNAVDKDHWPFTVWDLAGPGWGTVVAVCTTRENADRVRDALAAVDAKDSLGSRRPQTSPSAEGPGPDAG